MRKEQKGKAMVKCPSCDGQSEFFAEPVGPFCSRRCKMVDLGNWFNEEYTISDPLTPDAFGEYEEMEGPELDRPE